MYIYLLSCLLGIFVKVYDDIIDLKIQNCSIVLEVSKIIIIISSFLIIQKSYIFGIITLISLIVSHYCKNLDNTFWYAYSYFIACLCVIFFYKLKKMFKYFSFQFLLFVIFIPLCIYFEEVLHSEEISKNKMHSRTIGIVLNVILIFMLEFFDIIKKYKLHFFTYLILFVNSYFLTNIIIQLIFVNQEMGIMETMEEKNKETMEQKNKGIMEQKNKESMEEKNKETMEGSTNDVKKERKKKKKQIIQQCNK